MDYKLKLMQVQFRPGGFKIIRRGRIGNAGVRAHEAEGMPTGERFRLSSAG